MPAGAKLPSYLLIVTSAARPRVASPAGAASAAGVPLSRDNLATRPKSAENYLSQLEKEGRISRQLENHRQTDQGEDPHSPPKTKDVIQIDCLFEPIITNTIGQQ
jgi:hypothetical protein